MNFVNHWVAFDNGTFISFGGKKDPEIPENEYAVKVFLHFHF